MLNENFLTGCRVEEDNGSPQCSIIVMTVEHAARLIERRRPSARRHAGAVRAYARAMREGQWILNGMPIIISRQGLLLDGLQRLLACVEAQTPFETFLSERVEAAACHTIDQQRRRSFASVLEARGVPHAHALQATLIKLMRHNSGTDGELGPMPSWATMDRALRANPHLQPAVCASLALPGCPLPESVRSPLIAMGYQLDREKTNRLLDALMRPEFYAPTEPGVQLLHEIERGREVPSQSLSTTHLLALAIKALDATLNGVTLRRLYWGEPGAPAATAELFPRLRHYTGLAEQAPVANCATASLDSSAIGVAHARGTLNGAAQHGPEIAFAVEIINPGLAMQYLSHNIGNRHVSRAHVEAIARDIAQGRWMFNAQPICFARDGRLLNGQHRLQAVILADRGIEVQVVRGLNEAAYATYDNHAKRRADLGNRLDSFGDRALAYAMANLLWKHERKTLSMRSAKATAAEIQQIISEHPRLLVLRSFARKMGHLGRASVIGYAAYVMERDDSVLAPTFLAALENGSDQRPGHPVLALRAALQKSRGNKASQSEQLSLLLAGWERFKARASATGTPI
ncbi:MAG: hypothetical protein JWM91_4449 [Rhodospirillales bacterium]|nr:hypothetical protein [Rhodospirillales bacterium]